MMKHCPLENSLKNKENKSYDEHENNDFKSRDLRFVPSSKCTTGTTWEIVSGDLEKF